MFYDTHCHLNLPGFETEQSAILEDCFQNGLWLNNVGTTYASSVEALRIAHLYGKGIYAVVGSHPENFLPTEGDYALTLDPNFEIEKFRTLAQDQKVVGIGECGLDYYRLPAGVDLKKALELQAPSFFSQINLAKELDKALVIHCRPSANTNDAYEDCLKILEKEKPERFELHSFTGNWDICKKFLNLGAYIALNGIITFDKSGELSAVAKNVPIEKLLLETDAPYLAPVPFRGKKNQPKYIVHTAEQIAKLRGMVVGDLAKISFENALRLFGLDRA